jgi:hypothetical protein
VAKPEPAFTSNASAWPARTSTAATGSPILRSGTAPSEQSERADRPEQNDKALAVAGPQDADMAKRWMEIGRHLMANTTDVGQRFAEEARKIHYGEAPERGIRGQTSAREARELIEEGIGVLPFAVPEALKGPLQ